MGATEASAGSLLERVDPARAYVAALVGTVAALVGGSLLFPRTVWAGFLWQYFWGPVYADANGYDCALWDGGARTLVSGAECASAQGIVAVKGYTVVNEIGYAVTLVFAVVGLVTLLRRLDVGKTTALFYGLLPFMFLGGALRVVEDVNDAAVRAGVEPLLTWPANSLIISPVIYFTMFFVVLATLVGAIWLDRTGRIAGGYQRPLFGAGALFLVANLGYLLAMGLSTEYVYVLPQFTVVVLAVAAAVTWATWRGIEAWAPWINEGTGLVGAVLIFGHAIDGTANVVGLDWGAELGFPGGDLVGKHPVNRAIVDVTASVQPEALTNLVGTAWPFLVVKLAVVVVVLAIFDETVFEESPRYAILMLIAVLAVGLGPGTRDMLRATFGV